MLVHDILMDKKSNIYFIIENKYGLHYFKDNQLIRLVAHSEIRNYKKFFKAQQIKKNKKIMEIQDIHTIIHNTHKQRYILTMTDQCYVNKKYTQSNESNTTLISYNEYKKYLEGHQPYIKFKIRKGDKLTMYNIEDFLKNF